MRLGIFSLRKKRLKTFARKAIFYPKMKRCSHLWPLRPTLRQAEDR
jgi:hypothetical protein